MRVLILACLCASLASAASFAVSGMRIIQTNSTAASGCDSTVVGAAACNGWVLEVDIGNGVSSPAVGGTYALGLGTNNSPAAAAVIVTVTHNGYQGGGPGGGTCGTTTTYTQKLYAIRVLREPYNNAGTNDEVASGGTFTTRLALGSDTGPAMIFSGETVTAQIAANFYTDGSGNTNNSVSAGTSVTNNSTQAYSTARAIFNWTYPGFRRITGANFTVRGTGAAQWPKYSTPLACVVYTATDQHAHTNTATVTLPTIDPTLKDKAPIVEWIGTLATTGFTQADHISVTFKVYPWVGDSTSVLDSSDGTYVMNTPFYSTQYYVYDGTNTTYSSAAAVDPSQKATGSVTSGTFVSGEKVTQSTNGACSSTATAQAFLVGAPVGSANIVIGATITGTLNTTQSVCKWTGATSGAVYTQTGTITANGSDASCTAVGEASFNYPTSPSVACATVSGALAKIEALNNTNNTRTDACGTVWLETSAGWNWLGAASTTTNTTGYCWANIVNAPSVASFIQGQAGNQGFGTRCAANSLTNCGTPIHVNGIPVNVASAPTSVFSGITFLWMDSISSIVSNGTAPFYQFRIGYMTDSSIPSTLAGVGLGAFGGENAAWAIIRGNDLTTVGTAAVELYTVVGNTNTAAGNFNINDTTTGPPASIMPILAFNTFYFLNEGSNAPVGLFSTTSSPLGAVVMQNIFENLQTDTTNVVGIAADSSSGTPVNNVMYWGNTFAGGRSNRSYNDTGTTIKLRLLWSEVGNIFPKVAIKSDTFTTQNGNRVGNWADLYGSNNHNTLYWEDTSLTVAGQFCNEIYGINVYSTTITHNTTSPNTCGTNTDTWIKWKNPQAYNGSTGTGGGDYHLLSSSPAINFIPSGTQILPYDLVGQKRNNSGWGAAGALEQSILLTPVFGF